MMLHKTILPLRIEYFGFSITDAITDPTAMVEAKSKLDILAKVLSPKTRVMIIVTAKIAKTLKIGKITSVISNV